MQQFSQEFRSELIELMKWRRDVRHFKPDPIDPAQLSECLEAFRYAPSVGLSEPWRLVSVKTPQLRTKIFENFTSANADALNGLRGDKARTYASLKLAGIQDAPEQIAVFCDEETTKGSGLGAKTMPEMRRYSVVSAVTAFWLAARAHGIGVGWVSILDPCRVVTDLGVSANWRLVAYLCVGLPKNDTLTPELVTTGWERRNPELSQLIEV